LKRKLGASDHYALIMLVPVESVHVEELQRFDAVLREFDDQDHLRLIA
jgi:hypothetical protein